MSVFLNLLVMLLPSQAPIGILYTLANIELEELDTTSLLDEVEAGFALNY